MNSQEKIAELTRLQKALFVSGKNTWETHELPAICPSIFMADGPHGIRKQMGEADHLGLNESVPATCFPPAATIANSWDCELAAKVGECIGSEAKALEVDVVLGPGLNIKRNPKGGRNFEYFSEDPYLAGKMAAANIRGIQENGTIACPKHFAVNSQETRRMASDSIVDERTLREMYLTNFEIAVTEGKPKSIMSAYNLINGIYANENKRLLQEILRDEWGFAGFVVSDWGGDNDHVEGIRNGCHLAMPGQGIAGAQEIIEAIERNRLAESELDVRVAELAAVFSETKKQSGTDAIDWAQHHTVAREAARSSVVLLKNDDNCLPLNPKQKVGIIGDFAQTPRYQGAGSSMVNAKQVESILEKIGDYTPEMAGYAQGYVRKSSSKTATEQAALIEEAVSLADDCEVVLVFAGLDESYESEGNDRETLAMPANQNQLIEKLCQTTAKVIVVLSAGGVVEMPWLDKAAGVLHGYLGGQAGTSAMLDVIFGRYNPSGKLAESYPYSYDDVLFGQEFPATSRFAYYKERLFVGYRYYDTFKKPILFPFGYGLSYTEFAYSGLIIEENQVKFTIENVGDRDGEEVVQLYVGLKESQLMRPKKELKGFKKVALASGEKRTVTLPFDDKTFRVYDSQQNCWAVEAGEYTLFIGGNCEESQLQGTLLIDQKAATLRPRTVNEQAIYPERIEQATLHDFAQFLNQPLPQESSDQPLAKNSTIAELQQAKSPLGRLVFLVLNTMRKRNEKKGKLDLNLLFIWNMPFRGIAKMTNGMVSMAMIDQLLIICNGHFFKGSFGLCRAFIRNKKLQRKYKKQLSQLH